MALVNLISVQVVDDQGRAGNIPIPVPATYTLPEIQAYVTAMLPELDTVTAAKITRCSVSIGLTLPGALKANATADRPLEWGANFSFDAADTNYRHTVHIPSVDLGFVDGDEVDTGDVAVTGWLTQMVTGDGTVAPSDKYGNDLTSLIGAQATFRQA